MADVWFVIPHAKRFCSYYCLYLPWFPLDIRFMLRRYIHLSMICCSIYSNFLKCTYNWSNVCYKVCIYNTWHWIYHLCCPFANWTAAGDDEPLLNSSTFRVMLGQFTEDLLITGFRKNYLMSFSTLSVAVVRVIIGIFRKFVFNLCSSLNAFRKSFHSVYKCA